MSGVAGLNKFNNLLYATHKRAVCNQQEHKAGHIGMDLRYKGEAPINEVLTCKVSQLNGKHGDLRYQPKVLHSRPYGGYDARFDQTILNSIRDRYVNVSGVLIPNKDLRINSKNNHTVKTFSAYGIIS